MSQPDLLWPTFQGVDPSSEFENCGAKVVCRHGRLADDSGEVDERVGTIWRMMVAAFQRPKQRSPA